MSSRAHWPMDPLGEICRITIGRTPSRANPRYWQGDHPWLAISDMNDGPDLVSTAERITDAAVEECRCRPVEPGTLLMSFKLSVGKLGFARRRLFTNEAIAALPVREPKRDSPEYLFHALASLDLERGTDRAAMGRTLNKKKLKALKVPRPPLEEQERIAAVLDKAHSICRKRLDAVNLLEELLQSQFLSVFGDPVLNPNGWTEEQLAESLLTKPQIGTTRPASPRGEFKVVRVGELGDRNVRLESCGRVDLDDASLERFTLRRGEVLLARAIGSEAHLGKASVFQGADEPVVFDSHVMRLRFREEKLHPLVFLSWLRSAGGRACFMRKAGRTAVQFNVNARQLSSITMALPPIDLQYEFVEFAEDIDELLTREVAAGRAANHLSISLSQRAFRGEL